MSWELSVHGTYNDNHFFKTLYDFVNIIFPFVLNGMVIPISNFQHHRIDDVENF